MTQQDDDLLSQMHLLVLEQSHLFEFSIGSVDRLPSGDVRHGPWDPAECASALRAWYAKGWLLVFVDSDHADVHGTPDWWHRTYVLEGEPTQFRELHSSDADTLLRFSSKWLPGTQDGNVMLCSSPAGDSVPVAEWRDTANTELALSERSTSLYYRRPWFELRGDIPLLAAYSPPARLGSSAPLQKHSEAEQFSKRRKEGVKCLRDRVAGSVGTGLLPEDRMEASELVVDKWSSAPRAPTSPTLPPRASPWAPWNAPVPRSRPRMRPRASRIRLPTRR